MELKEFLDLKYQYLKSFIDSPENKEGRQSHYTGNGYYNRIYDRRSTYNPDARGFQWLKYLYNKIVINQEYHLYKKAEGKKIIYIVKKDSENYFLQDYPKGVKVKIDLDFVNRKRIRSKG